MMVLPMYFGFMRQWMLAFLLLAVATTAFAEEAVPDESVLLVSSGATYRVWTAEVQPPAMRYGQVALHDLRVAQGDNQTERPLLLEPLPPAPRGWPTVGLEGGGMTGTAPFAYPAANTANSEGLRTAVLWASHHFTVPSPVRATAFELLVLRVEYRDGLRVHLNGELIAERNINDSRSPAAIREHGPEWEEFTIPLLPGMLRDGENVLSLEVRPSLNNHRVRLDAELLLANPQRLSRGPILFGVQAKRAGIAFDTALPVVAQVEYGSTPELGKVRKSASGALLRHHRVTIPDLQAGQAVHYRIRTKNFVSKIRVFHTPPKPTEPLHFAVYGDTRGGHRVHSKIVTSLLHEVLDFVIVTGDLIARGSDEADWQRFFGVTKELLARYPYYPAVGNHDTGKSGDEQRRMNEIFPLWPGPVTRPAWGHWHSFDISGVHFVMLDSNSYEHREQLEWLEQDLQTARANQSRAIFVSAHHGPYSRGPHGGNEFAVEHYVPLLQKYRVNFLWTGHDHLYQRGEVDGLPYIVSGGGGAPLYSIRCGLPKGPKCDKPDGMKYVAKEHHYVMVSVYPQFIEVCPKRPDSSALEPCIHYPLGHSD